jgi:L-histidine N-alpha-methyltransferase
MKTPQFIQQHHEKVQSIRAELLWGLNANPAKNGAFTSPKYLYDTLGSRLFEAITELPEYYPTRTENAIFLAHGAAITNHVPQDAALIDLGAGNCQKAASLFERFKPARYIAVDISVDFLRATLSALQGQHPHMAMAGVGMDFSHSLALPSAALGDIALPQVFFYPGSSIGNFTPDEALAFLQRIRAACPQPGTQPKQSGLLIGIDLVKDKVPLEAAYNDALGVTAAFNRNVLLSLNRLIGSNFALADWSHVALYNEQLSRIEMHLQARRAVTVCWSGGQRIFQQGERIHTENSYKWTTQGFSALLERAGFTPPTVWTDAQNTYAVMWAAASQ